MLLLAAALLVTADLVEGGWRGPGLGMSGSPLFLAARSSTAPSTRTSSSIPYNNCVCIPRWALAFAALGISSAASVRRNALRGLSVV
jgi:hypothetical protein